MNQHKRFGMVISDRLDERLRAYCEARGIGLSNIVRIAIDNHLQAAGF